MKKLLSRTEPSSPDGLLLVSSSHPLPREAKRPSLVPALPWTPDVLLKPEAALSLQKALSSIRSGRRITAVSGFRTQKEQRQLFDESVRKSGLSFTSRYVALPGCSEHQTGLAVDLGENGKPLDLICPSFPPTGIFQSFRRAAPLFGFVERYPQGKEAVTGIGAEPWHFRYVGLPHSRIMAKAGLTLEEYLSFLKAGTSPKSPYHYRDEKLCAEVFYADISEAAAIRVPDGLSADCSLVGNGGVVAVLTGGRWDG